MKSRLLHCRLQGICLAAFLLALIVGCQPETQSITEATTTRFEFERNAMGVLFRVIVYGKERAQTENDFDEAWKTVEKLDSVLSDYKHDSEINQLCATAPHAAPVPISNTLRRALILSKEVYEKTNGAFDVTVGPSSRLWRTAIKRNRFPEPDEISEALQHVGMNKIEFHDDGSIRLTESGMQIDFGGIAKGMAADDLIMQMNERGYANVLVDASGDVTASGVPPGDKIWDVKVAAIDDYTPFRVALRDFSVASSGDWFQYIEHDGVRYSHIVDPRTGVGVTHTSVVTIIAPTGTLADAYATAFSVMPSEIASGLVEHIPDVEALIVRKRKNESNFLLESSGLMQRLTREKPNQ
ncbi:MAG: FAD:protein FMN transferase [Pirellulaceae bacterium]